MEGPVSAPHSSVQIRYDYDNVSFGFHDKSHSKFDTDNDCLIVRDVEKESHLRSQLPINMLEPVGDAYDREVDFRIHINDSMEIVHALLEQGWIVDSQGARIQQADDFKFNIKTDVDWFDVTATVNFGGQEIQLPELLKAAKQGSRFVQLR